MFIFYICHLRNFLCSWFPTVFHTLLHYRFVVHHSQSPIPIMRNLFLSSFLPSFLLLRASALPTSCLYYCYYYYHFFFLGFTFGNSLSCLPAFLTFPITLLAPALTSSVMVVRLISLGAVKSEPSLPGAAPSSL